MTKVAFRKVGCRLIAATLFASNTPAWGNLVQNGDFELGSFAGWTLFTTSAGLIGTPTTPGTPGVSTFNTSGSAVSLAAHFSVASVAFVSLEAQEGGGLFQNFLSPDGVLSISLDVASDRPAMIFNGEGGIFSIMVDSIVVGSFATGLIPEDSTVRHSFELTTPIAAGSHELRILITRPFTTSSVELSQYVDNITVVTSPIPEPGVAALIALGAAGIAVATRRRKGSSDA